jgi:hypothetical protein
VIRLEAARKTAGMRDPEEAGGVHLGKT